MKIGIIGAGAVGSAAAFALIMTGTADKVVLVDINRAKAEAEATDIAHAAPFASAGKICAGDYGDLQGCDIVIVTAGANQKQGETRIDLLERNVRIFENVIPQIARYAPRSILLITANPADIMTEVALRLSGFPQERVIGSGTVLDTARFRTLLADYLGVSTKSVHADVLGEHGDSEVLIWSSAEAGTLSLEEYAADVGKTLDETKKAEINDGVVRAAYKIIAGKGATAYGIAGALTQICRAIDNNDHSILTVSSHHNEAEGIKDVCLSLPTVVCRQGVYHVITPKLSAEEHIKLRKSAETMKNYTEKALSMIVTSAG
ncbi:MAG: L-lactate dehydrogenase [Alphaproteobacteria bacterium]|nr:L-lactate dehydrogenase [Alphaproteobacteria bacterium]